MNDLSTYALGIAALLVAALAATGLVLTTTDAAAPAAAPEAHAMHVDAGARALATMNVPF